jgi:hypothetical protein
MDGNRFDRLVASLADAGSSRRSLLGRLAGGGLATALVALGIGGVSTESAEAKKKKKSCARCKKKNSPQKRRRCRRRCGKQNGGPAGFAATNNTFTTPIGPGGTCTAGVVGPPGCGVGAMCVVGPEGTNVCVDQTLVDTCASSAECATGFCSNIVNGVGVCALCGTQGTELCGTAPNQQCCVVGASCPPTGNVCVFG